MAFGKSSEIVHHELEAVLKTDPKDRPKALSTLAKCEATVWDELSRSGDTPLAIAAGNGLLVVTNVRTFEASKKSLSRQIPHLDVAETKIYSWKELGNFQVEILTQAAMYAASGSHEKWQAMISFYVSSLYVGQEICAAIDDLT